MKKKRGSCALPVAHRAVAGLAGGESLMLAVYRRL